MKQIAMIHRAFEYRWDTLAGDDRLFENFHSWWSCFEGLLIDAFWDVFEEGKKSLERDPARFAYETLTRWCLAADGSGMMLFEVENHYDWSDLLRDLEHATRSEIFPEDFGYRPVPKLCLATISTLPARSPNTQPMLNEMHPHLTPAVGAILAGNGCATVEEAVERFPVLKGLTNDELIRLRGNRGIAVGTAAVDLLCPRLPLHQPSTVGRFYRPYRPKEFRRR